MPPERVLGQFIYIRQDQAAEPGPAQGDVDPAVVGQEADARPALGLLAAPADLPGPHRTENYYLRLPALEGVHGPRGAAVLCGQHPRLLRVGGYHCGLQACLLLEQPAQLGRQLGLAGVGVGAAGELLGRVHVEQHEPVREGVARQPPRRRPASPQSVSVEQGGYNSRDVRVHAVLGVEAGHRDAAACQPLEQADVVAQRHRLPREVGGRQLAGVA